MSDSFNESKKHRERQHKRKNAILIGIFILSALLIGGGYLAVMYYLPNNMQVPLYKYFTELDADKMQLVVGGKRISPDNAPVLKEQELYIPVDFVKEYIDPYIFWENSADRLTITTENRVIRMRTEELTYYVNNDVLKLNIPVYNIGGMAYLPSSMLAELYDVEFQYSETYNTAVMDYITDSKTIYEVTAKKADLRYEADKKSPIQEKLVLGDKLTFFGNQGDYIRVRTANGGIGYVLAKNTNLTEVIPGVEKEISKAPKTIEKKHVGKINILWDQVTSFEASSNTERRIAYDGLDVICPTWFSFDKEKMNGDIINIADKSYVDWAHKNGMQVWALISDNFSGEVSHMFLTDAQIREDVIKQILSFISMYNLDGINLDFEMVREVDAAYYIQFLRELAPFMKAQGAVLSVDMYVPMSYNLYYNRTEIGNSADYLIIMGYDEHHSSSEVSGPVASINFVRNGIIDTLQEVPKEKVILGLPYFVRVWRETPQDDGSVKVSSNAYSMDRAYKQFVDKGALFVWNEETANYYAEYTEKEEGKDVVYKVWLEEERSIQEKLMLVNEFDLAGIAGWKKGLQKDIIWDLLHDYLKTSVAEAK